MNLASESNHSWGIAPGVLSCVLAMEILLEIFF